MTSPDFRHSDEYAPRITPGWVLDRIPGGTDASAAFERADADYRVAQHAADLAALPVGEEQRKLDHRSAGASAVALDAAMAERDERAAELVAAKRARTAARRVVADLIDGKTRATDALIERTAGELVLAAREDAARALAELKSAFKQIDEYVSYAAGLVTNLDSPEIELLVGCREAGLDEAATLAEFRDRGLTPPGSGAREDWLTAPISRRRVLHLTAAREPLSAVEAALAAVPTAPAVVSSTEVPA
ncbi:hypothetical protein DZF92_04610 [Clavibacter michiganensis subsp. insidiosus]|uniref:Uncharacterized protein n=1 Tax=Clavibacter michiganensis subsp. insidiosus TaxID=33014 RepID=A0A399SNJ2_9MICO|nr:hypothetical protein [Clavibacter michiganensis]AWG01188.1 hypothetical protein BEH62_06210 [Clavibacter michiganensis subsp. insidiosus]OQJ60253.1 hypothetical protein B5P21_10280 [Clavibacter michiganensis subsp. insidiosus]RII88050.1 hypothetical protein DZF92_04610 [Clavibacter michiganensis subsp. insidiosus]RIJ43902.1 hypothetical protein DZF93_04840 [Clavibacter michiganensis subsp. insidiosus]RMC85601.1 hypothetical protein CmiCFBP2404_07265 [Clavibacter michiganensis subsp. insidio